MAFCKAGHHSFISPIAFIHVLCFSVIKMLTPGGVVFKSDPPSQLAITGRMWSARKLAILARTLSCASSIDTCSVLKIARRVESPDLETKL